MTCKQFRPYIVDLARGAIDAASVEAPLTRHVRSCQECRALLERERMTSAALGRLARATEVPASDPARERALLDMFDRARTSPPHPRVSVWVWSSGVAAAKTGQL